MAFIEFLKHNKEKESNKGPDQVPFPLHANRNVAKLFEQKIRRDSEPSDSTIVISTKNNKRNSKSEENIFEKIETGSGSSNASNKRYGTLPKSKLLCEKDILDNDVEPYENQKVSFCCYFTVFICFNEPSKNFMPLFSNVIVDACMNILCVNVCSVPTHPC